MNLNGYPIIYRPDHPKSNRDGYIYEHIIIAEKQLGRPLKDGEVVHHRDKNRSNNNPANLLVFSSKSDHTSFHHHNCDENLLILLEDGSYTINYLKNNICPECGKKKDKNSNICQNCRKILGAPNKKINENILTKDSLKYLIRNKTFVEIGKMFNVTDNTIRKWCDKYGLPRTKKAIKQFSDDQWKNI